MWQSVHTEECCSEFIYRRLELSEDKSKSIHIGKTNKCKEKCPSLKVHENDMKNATSTSKGGSHETIEKRRSEGWGRGSKIVGLISEVTTGNFRKKIGLKLHQTKLCNGSLYNGEAWSSISERDM